LWQCCSLSCISQSRTPCRSPPDAGRGAHRGRVSTLDVVRSWDATLNSLPPHS
jgi:hypothetical protein